MIQPSLGRVVWFTPHDSDSMARGNEGRCAGLVVHVHSDRCVNLAVFDANGRSHPQTSVRLLQDDDERPEAGFYCEWMPFQKSRQAKYEQLETQVAKEREERSR